MKVPKGRVIFCILLSAMLISVAVVPLAAQSAGQSEANAGSLIYASGSGFELVREGIKKEYDLSSDMVEGLDFYTGDYVNTYDDTFLEIQVSESSHLLKISENTSFKFDKSTHTDTAQYEVSYGRVRARVRKMAGLERFAISGPSMVAGVRGTDFGYDVLFDFEENTTVASVYCFEGKVEVEPTVEVIEETDAGEVVLSAEAVSKIVSPIEIGADEMVQVRELAARQAESGVERESAAEQLFVLRRSAVENEIKAYWKENDFKAVPVKLESEAETEQETVHEDEASEPPPGVQFISPQLKLRRASMWTAGIGTVFGVAALTFAYADPLVGDMDTGLREDLTQYMGVSAGLFFSTSLFTLIASFF